MRRAPGHADLPEERAAPARLSPPQGFRRASPPSRGPASGPACAQARWRLLAGWRLRTRAPRASPREEPEGGDAGVRAWDGVGRLILGGRPTCARLLGSASHFPHPYVGNRFGADPISATFALQGCTFLPCAFAFFCFSVVWVCSGDPYYYFILFWFGGTPGGTGRLLLVLCSEMTPSWVEGFYGMPGIEPGSVLLLSSCSGPSAADFTQCLIGSSSQSREG